MFPAGSIQAPNPSSATATATGTATATATDATPTKLPLPKKRVSRACDECRLHKARCDGATFCETCRRYNRVCSYNLLPLECKGSAARIRILEHRLVRARECISQLQEQLSPNPGAHLHTSLALQPQSQPQHQSRLSVSSPQDPMVVDSVLPALPTRLSGSETPEAPGLGLSLIQTLLQPLPENDKLTLLMQSRLARSMLCDTGSADDLPSDRVCQLPPYDTMIEVIYVAFNSVFALCNTLTEQDFRVASQRLYDVDPTSYTPEDADFVPLFCSVIALGMIHCSKIHEQLGYEYVLKESLLYFEAASTSIANNQECATIAKLQTTLCLVLYLVNTSQLDLARPALKIICASEMVQDLFRSLSTQSLTPSPASTSSSLVHYFSADVRRKDIVWTIIYLDMHVSSLLRVPCLLPEPGPNMATVHAVNTASHNVAHYKRSDSTFLLSVSLAMAIELMKLIRRISLITPAMMSDANALAGLSSTEAAEWTDLRNELGTWEFILQSVFPENEANPILCLVRHQLQCHLYLTQIILYLPYLRHHADSVAMKSPSQIDDINKGRACITAASSAIMYTSMYLEQTQVTTLSWHSAYVVFISLLALLVATSFTDALGRHTLQHTIRVAVQTLSTSTYGSSRSKSSYLEFAQAVSINMTPPINIRTTHRSSFSSDTTIFSPQPVKSSNKVSSQDASSTSEGSGLSGTTQSERSWWLPIMKEEPQGPPDQWGFDHS